jgi:hypothetical protein
VKYPHPGYGIVVIGCFRCTVAFNVCQYIFGGVFCKKQKQHPLISAWLSAERKSDLFGRLVKWLDMIDERQSSEKAEM